MERVKQLIEQALTTPSKSKGCGCGCGCGGEKVKSPILKEVKVKDLLSEGLNYHIDNKISLFECEYRIGSEAHLSLIRESRKLYSRGVIDVSESDKLLLETDLGHFAEFKGELIPLDLPMLNEKEGVPHYTKDGKEWKGKTHKMPDGSLMSGNPHDVNGSGPNGKSETLYHKEDLNEGLQEADYQGKDVELNKPKRGGSKAYYVYVKDGDKVKKVSFGSGGLKAKINNKEARNNFASRHNCKDKKDRTTPGYWSCNLPKYAKVLGMGENMNTYW